MRLPGLFRGLVSRMTEKSQSFSAVNQSGGWLTFIRESFAGAWQSVVQVDAPKNILAFSGVFACVTMIASDIAKLRIKLVKEAEGICTEVTDASSPFVQLLKKPNRYQNRIKFIEQWIVSKLLWGNAYALKVRDGRSMVKGLYLLDAQRVTVLVTDEGDVWYQIGADHLSGLKDSITVPASEIIHDMMVSLWHPLVGVSPIYACGMSATLGNSIQSNSTRFFKNFSRPSGILTAPTKVNPENANKLKEEWDKNYGGENVGKLAVLGDGLKYQPMTIPANDAQLIEQLKWTVEDVARCFHVPLYKIGGTVPANATVETLNQGYYSDCLQALIESLELCLDEGIGVPSGTYTEVDLDGLLRMDSAAQIEMLAAGIKGTVMKPNEGRAKLNLPPVAGGDTIYLQQQNFSLAALAKRDALPNPFVIDKPTTNPTPSDTGPAAEADAAKAAAEFAVFMDTVTKGLEHA